MKRIVLIAAVLAVAACTTPGIDPTTGAATSVPFSPAQDAYLVLKAATAIEKEAASVKKTPGLSALVISQIQVGQVGTANGVQGSVDQMLQNGSIGSAVLSGLEQAAVSSISSLGATLAASHGSTATIQQIAIANTLPLLTQAAAIANVTIQLRSGFQPSPADIQAARDELNAAAGS